jgi:hypothetical protein
MNDQEDTTKSAFARFEEIVGEIKYRDWKFLLVAEGHSGKIYLQVSFVGSDIVTGEDVEQRGRKWYLSEHMTKSEVVLTAFKAVQTAEEHELRERFRYRGRLIFGPHFDVDELWKIADGKHIDVRVPVGLSYLLRGEKVHSGVS